MLQLHTGNIVYISILSDLTLKVVSLNRQNVIQVWMKQSSEILVSGISQITWLLLNYFFMIYEVLIISAEYKIIYFFFGNTPLIDFWYK